MSKETMSRVEIGCQVELDLIYRSGEKERLTLDLVVDSMADYESGFLGISTPLANTILGESSDYLIPYFTDEFQAVQIQTITKSIRTPEQTASTRIEAKLRETREHIEFRDAVLFAASTDSKWGSYDADGLDYDQWKSGEVNAEDQHFHKPEG